MLFLLQPFRYDLFCKRDSAIQFQTNGFCNQGRFGSFTHRYVNIYVSLVSHKWTILKACNVSLSFTWFHLDVYFKRFQYVYSPWKTFENWPELKPASLKTHAIQTTSFDVICDCFGLELSF